MKRISIKDIAKAANVSTALVSYVLNGKAKEKRVSDESVRLIQQKANELGYRPNVLARSLQSGRSQLLGLIVADIANPLFADIANVIEDEAQRKQYDVLFGNANENAGQLARIVHLLSPHVDGLIVVPTEPTDVVSKAIAEARVPTVLLDRTLPSLMLNSVGIDNYQAAYEATQHLLGKGYQRIAFITYKTTLEQIRERRRGYQQALRDKGFWQSDFSREIGQEYLAQSVQATLSELLSQPEKPDAILFATHRLAIEGLKYISHTSLRVPDDVAVITFDQSETLDLFYPPITYIEQPTEMLGRMAVKLLLGQIAQPDASVQQVQLPTQLRVRASSGW